MRFRILGPLEVWTGQGWGGIGAPKWRALLAALLLNPGQAVSTDRLIAELWGDDPPDRAANLISVYVFRLRRLIDDAEGRVLTTRAPGYQLQLAPGDVDAEGFEALVGQGRQALAHGDFRSAAATMTEAVGLWQGQALADVPPSALVTAEAGRLEEYRLDAVELRLEADIGCGRHAELVPELRRLVSSQPLREGLWGLLIRALDRAGRHAEALAAYGEARQVIADELGVDPGPELQRLYQNLLTADLATQREPPAGPPLPAPPVAARDWGHRPAAPARGGHRPGPATDGPHRPTEGSRRRGPHSPGLRRVPAQLPADVGDFTGRVLHLERLCGLVTEARRQDSPAVTVAVVAGAPGLGKTALAIHAAHALRPDFPDGQLYVSLLGGRQQPVPADEVLARFLRDLGVDGSRVPVDAEERAALYRTRLAERQILIALDDARDAAQVRPLLPGTGSCAVIITSRHRLSALAGSRLIDLDVLGDDEAAELFTRVIGADRAAAEPDAVRDVLTSCAGLPLAIRIAGARLAARPGWSVRTLADRLTDQRRRMDELTAGDLAVRACFQVSFDALPRSAGRADAAHVFRMLGVWQGPSIDVRAAAALIGQPEQDVAGALEVLVDAHLLESPAPDRYAFHELLRAYASDRAQADEPGPAIDDAIGRVVTWYLRTADAAASVVSPHRARVPLEPAEPGREPLAFGTADQALAWCEQERANLVAATRQAAERGRHDIAWKLPVAAMVCFDFHGYRTEWITTHRIGLASARAQGDQAGEAWVLNNLGMVLSQQRDNAAIDYFAQAMAIRRETGDLQGQAQATNNLAFHYRFLGRHEEAAATLLEALDLQRQVGHRYGEAITLCNLGEACLELGRYEEATAWSQDALAVVREIGSSRLEGYARYNLGRIDLSRGRPAEAAGQLGQALDLHRAAGDRYGEAQDLQYLGHTHVQAGRPADAREAWERARRLFESLGDDTLAAELRTRLRELGSAPSKGLSDSGRPTEKGSLGALPGYPV
ncbi:MAG TPA: BTAD domain-containing putative transcriptional regulator [Streptosporangiaceae bacterium]